MTRLPLVFLFAAAACGGSGFNTAEATITGLPTVKSASATPFLTTDTPPTMGWTIDFIDAGAGTDCMDQNTTIVATIGIYTKQPDNGMHTGAVLSTGEISIITMSPPTVQGTAAANMAANGLHGITGNVTITDSYKDHIYGMINAIGTDGSGTAVSLTGSFKAPACGKP
ncbi:MAG: hypothetical protein JWO36_3410 [Myxococcales bacterium]|nr:hypothetical protein [Myxococcales bacterium]